MILCPIQSDGYCERHHRRHIGHSAQIAREESEKAEKIRRAWDRSTAGNGPGEGKPLSLARKMANYASALARHVANGSLIVPDDIRAMRRAHCDGCPFRDREKDECRVCGCALHATFLGDKLAWASEACPRGHWPTWQPGGYQAIHTRHLLYHLYPVSHNGTWQWNVEQLCGRLKAFNGKKIVAIAIDPPSGRKQDPGPPFHPDGCRDIRGCDTADDVKQEFARRWPHDDIEFMEFENDPGLREVVSLVPMLEKLPKDDPHSVTLYGQAKGVTRPNGHIARRWTEAVYEIYFDHFPLAMEQLMKKPCTGAFKKLGPGWSAQQSKSDWHFSCSFFWFRNVELFARDWRKVDQFWSGVEPFPSQQFLASEADTMFLEAKVPDMNCYLPNYHRQVIGPALVKFRSEMAKYRTDLWPR